MVNLTSINDATIFDNKALLLSKKLSNKRCELNISVYEIAQAIGISEEEYIAYEDGVEEIPASVLFLVSVILDGNPLAYLELLESDFSTAYGQGIHAGFKAS